MTTVTTTIESLSNDGGDGNENVKKATDLITKTTTLNMHCIVWYISQFAVTARLGREISSDGKLMGDANTRRRIFLSLLNLGVVSKNSTP